MACKTTTAHNGSPGRIDLGLDLLRRHLVETGQGRYSHTAEEIAAWCGCSGENIRHIEKQALAKCWVRLRELGVEMDGMD